MKKDNSFNSVVIEILSYRQKNLNTIYNRIKLKKSDKYKAFLRIENQIVQPFFS